MNSLPRFRRSLRPYAGKLAQGVLLSLVVAVATASVAALLKPMFNDVFFPGQAPVVEAAGADPLVAWRQALSRQVADVAGRLVGYRRENAWAVVPACFLLAFMVKGLFTYLASYRLGQVGLGVVRDLRRDLYEHIQRQSLRFFADHPTGTLITRVTSDVTLLQNVLGMPLAESLRMGLSLVFLFAVAILMDWKMALTCALVLPLTVYPAIRFAGRLKASTASGQSRLAEVANRMQETIIGRRVVRSFNSESYEIGRFRRVLERLLQADRRALKYMSLTPPAIEVIGALAMASVAAFAGWRIAAGRLNPGDFVATLAALYWMYTILKRFARLGNDMTRGLAAAERVMAVLEQGQDVPEAPGAPAMPPLRRHIRFHQVGFNYGAVPVLRGIDLVVHKGEKVALVGASGAGKTTLVNLLPRFYDPGSGRVEIDGVDVRQYSLRSLREQIGMVTQDVVLFQDTVRANIAYGRPHAPMEQIVSAARAAHADAFIAGLPDGYDTMLGEGGQSLSAGQRQRIAIARALLKDAPVLIMDEAMSALDRENEALVQEAMEELMRDRTAVIIAHRLATVRAADRIVVLEGGRVVEEGTHEVLMTRAGAYTRLHRLNLSPAPGSLP